MHSTPWNLAAPPHGQLTSSNPRSFGKVPGLNASDQFVFVIYSIPPHQGWFPLPTFWKTEDGAVNNKAESLARLTRDSLSGQSGGGVVCCEWRSAYLELPCTLLLDDMLDSDAHLRRGSSCLLGLSSFSGSMEKPLDRPAGERHEKGLSVTNSWQVQCVHKLSQFFLIMDIVIIFQSDSILIE